eukprot:41311_1
MKQEQDKFKSKEGETESKLQNNECDTKVQEYESMNDINCVTDKYVIKINESNPDKINDDEIDEHTNVILKNRRHKPTRINECKDQYKATFCCEGSKHIK